MTQPLADGCERDPAGVLARTSPAWVYVHGNSVPALVRGTVREARPNFEDLYTDHDSYDFNIYVEPDPEDHRFLATANLLPAPESPEYEGTIEVEWEERAFPIFAWPTPGDRVEILGSWVWDCGHWGQELDNPGYLVPGTLPGEPGVPGERTEIHPPRLVVVHRAPPVVGEHGEQVVDVFASSEGTLARAVAEHAARRCRGLTFEECSQWIPLNERDYYLQVAAPARPAGATRLVWTVVDEGSENAPEPFVSEDGDGLNVTLPFRGHGRPGERMVLAKRFLIGWDATPPVQEARVVFESVDWLAELDGDQAGPCVPTRPCTGTAQRSAPPDEVALYAEAAGTWRRLAAPRLDQARPGSTYPIEETVDLNLLAADGWRLYARARECDAPDMRECPAPDELGFNENAGTVSAKAAPTPWGPGVLEGVSAACETSAAGPCFRLHYRIEDQGLVAASAPPPTEKSPGFALLLAMLALACLAARRHR